MTAASSRSAPRSTRGGKPPRWSWRTSAHADPDSSSRVVPSRYSAWPAADQPDGMRRSTSSRTPRTPTTGVGWMAVSPVEL